MMSTDTPFGSSFFFFLSIRWMAINITPPKARMFGQLSSSVLGKFLFLRFWPCIFFVFHNKADRRTEEQSVSYSPDSLFQAKMVLKFPGSIGFVSRGLRVAGCVIWGVVLICCGGLNRVGLLVFWGRFGFLWLFWGQPINRRVKYMIIVYMMVSESV